MSERVCDCPEACACYAKGYAQGKGKAYFEMASTGPSTPRVVVVSRAAPTARSW